MAASVAVLAVVVVGLSACGGSNDECLVLANGNKLCGADAAAWCESTDPLRDIADDAGDARLTEINDRTRAACDDIRGVSVSASIEPSRTADPDWTRTATPTASPKPEVALSVHKLIPGARINDLSNENVALLFDTGRASVVISGEIQPSAAEVRLLRAKGSGGNGWEPGSRSAAVNQGEFSVHVRLRPGENNFKLVGSARGFRGDSVLVAIVRS